MTREVYWTAHTILEDKVIIKGGQESLVLSESLCTLLNESCKESIKVLQEEFDKL